MSTPRITSTNATLSPHITQGLTGDRRCDRPATNSLRHNTDIFKMQINLIYI